MSGNQEHPLTRLRVDHVGSFLRPQALKDAFTRRGRNEIDQATLDAAIESAIRELVAKEERIGLPILSDGEYRRLSWQGSFSEVDGWDMSAGAWRGYLARPDNIMPGEKPLSKGKDTVVSQRTPATRKLALAKNFPLAEYRFAAGLTRRPVKAMMMGPDRVAQMCDLAASRPHYTSSDEFLADVIRVQHQMIGQLVDAGCPYVQIDEPSYTGYVDATTLARMKQEGEDPAKGLARAIAADNAVIAGYKGRATFAIHICRGNRASMWHREGAYDAIAEQIFGGLAYDRLLLEYDNERAGTFDPLRYVPKGKMVVLGLVTTKSGALESKADLLKRIEQATRYIPLEQLAISPQCGFASGIAGNLLTEDEQWRKMDLLVEIAHEVWK